MSFEAPRPPPAEAFLVAEASKLHSEILQLLNQQFLIVIGALTFFGTSVAFLVPYVAGLMQGKPLEARVPYLPSIYVPSTSPRPCC